MIDSLTKTNLPTRTTFDLYFGPFADRRVAAFHLKKKRRNLFLTITDITGAVVSSVSAKLFANDRKKRFAPHIVELAVRQLALILKAYRIYAVRFFIKVKRSYLIRSVIRTLKQNKIGITFAMDLIAVAHNGCRKKKTTAII